MRFSTYVSNMLVLEVLKLALWPVYVMHILVIYSLLACLKFRHGGYIYGHFVSCIKANNDAMRSACVKMYIPRKPIKVTLYPCLLRESAWYCMRGLRPISPSTNTQTFKCASSSRPLNPLASTKISTTTATGKRAHDKLNPDNSPKTTNETVTTATAALASAIVFSWIWRGWK